MELTMNMSAFEQLDNCEMTGIDGGAINWAGVGNALQLTAGTVLIVWAPIVGAAVAVSTAGAGTAAGVAVASGMVSAGCSFIGNTVK